MALPACLEEYYYTYFPSPKHLSVIIRNWYFCQHDGIRAYSNMKKHTASWKCNSVCYAFFLGFNDLSKRWHVLFFLFCHTQNSVYSSLGKSPPWLIQQWQLVHKWSTSLHSRKLKICVDLNEDAMNTGSIGFNAIRSLSHFFPSFCPKTAVDQLLCFQVWWVILNKDVQDGRERREAAHGIRRVFNTALERTPSMKRSRCHQWTAALYPYT